jgi:hypothetical protein
LTAAATTMGPPSLPVLFKFSALDARMPSFASTGETRWRFL